MGTLRWILIVWSTLALLVFLAQPFILPTMVTPGRLSALALSAVFYVLNLVFLLRSKPSTL